MADLTGPPPYHRGELYRNLSDVRGYLAELRYIDRALDYLSQEEARWWQGWELLGGIAYVDVELGQTVPFTKMYRVPEKFPRFFWQRSKATEINSHLEVIAEEATAWAATAIESITSWIEPFTAPLASTYEYRTIMPLETIHDMLEDKVSTDFGRLSHSLGNWEGEAADNFATYFYYPFEDTLRSQRQLIAALAGGMLTAKAIVESTQHSLMNVVHHLREELLEQLELRARHAERSRQESLRDALIIGGGTATILGAVASGGLWTVAMGTVAGGTTIASTTIPDGASDPYQLRGGTAEELLDALSDAVNQIGLNDDHQHLQLADAVWDVLERVEHLRGGSDAGDGRLIPIRPDIVGGVDGDDFYLP